MDQRPPTRTCVMTFSGNYVDLCNPSPSSINLADVARGLRRSKRFNGQLVENCDAYHQSLAAHSLRVARICKILWPLGEHLDLDTLQDLHPARVRLLVSFAAVMHDSPEGIDGDRPGPGKTEADKGREAALLLAILESLVGPDHARTVASLVHHPIVKLADQVALLQEALIWMPHGRRWAMPEQEAWDGIGGLPTPTQAMLTQCLPAFWPREGENWQAVAEAMAARICMGVTDDVAGLD